MDSLTWAPGGCNLVAEAAYNKDYVKYYFGEGDAVCFWLDNHRLWGSSGAPFAWLI